MPDQILKAIRKNNSQNIEIIEQTEEKRDCIGCRDCIDCRDNIKDIIKVAK